MDMENNKEQIYLTGKVAKFPKNVKAGTALQYLEKIKVNPSKIWYIIVENQDTELKLVKYNRAKGVDLLDYTTELKNQYRILYAKNKELLSLIENIEVFGEKDFSIIKNIPNITIDESRGLKLLSKITSDLVKLLAD